MEAEADSPPDLGAGMTISLTCACGVHLEIDDTFAGKTVNCPDCQRPLVVPKPEPAGLQTSGFALASLILALVGAFTLLGTALAVVFGLLALRDITRRPEQVSGRRYALAGIYLGAFLTVVSFVVLSTIDLFGLSSLPARLHWAGKLDYSGPEEVVRRTEDYAIKRPSPKWGVKRSEREEAQHVWDDLLMVNVEQDAHLLCYAHTVDKDWSLDRCREEVLKEFRNTDRGEMFGGAARPTPRPASVYVITTKELPKLGTAEIAEVLVDKSMAGQHRCFLIRVIKAPEEGTAFVLIGGTRQRHFARVQPEIRKAMDSFRRVGVDGP
jgi:hypothetical protein